MSKYYMDVFEFLSYMVEEEHRALDKLIGELVDNDLDKPLLENDKTTIRERLSHILTAEYNMAGYLFKVPDDEFVLKNKTCDELLNSSNISKLRHLLTLKNMDSDDLDKIWTSEVSGNSYTYKFLLWHFIEHIATHRGQVAMAVRRIRDN